MNLDLNDLQLPTDGDPKSQSEYDDNDADARVRCHFKGLATQLIAYVARSAEVFGCVAWLTDERILEALAGCRAASILVQKEDFLRPDVGGPSKDRLRALYRKLPGADRWYMDIANQYSMCGDSSVEGVRCVGVAQRRHRVAPRMHHKFLVFCRHDRIQAANPDEEVNTYPVPYAVWTGSFNFTNNGGRSFENAVYIESERVAQAYYREYAQVLLLSEPLDWQSEYVEPEWRIGT